MKIKIGGILVDKVLQSIQDWNDDNTPTDVELTDCQVRSIYNTYQLNCIEPDEKWQVRLAHAISRILAQTNLEKKCDCLPHSYMLRVRDKQALRRMLNNYCLSIAEEYDSNPAFRGMIFHQYNKMTQIIYLLQ
jgi:hypothetical protein